MTISVAFKNVAKLRDITSFGAVADSATDCTAAIQAAIDDAAADGGGVVYVPPASAANAYYRLQKRLILKSNVELVGAGYASYLYNDRSAGVTNGDQSVIGFGGYSAGTAATRPDDETFYNCNNVTRGDQTITVTTPAQAANFAIGDLVFIRNNTTDPNSSHNVYTFAELNEVTSSNSGTGAVGLKYPLYDTGTTMRMAKSSGTLTDQLGNAIQLRKNVRVANLRLENYFDSSFGIFIYGGCLGGIFENLYIDGSDAFSLNAMYRCTFRNIRGRVSQKVIDHAFYSGFNLYSDIDLEQGRTPTTGQTKIILGELTHDTTLRNVKVNGGTENQAGLSMKACFRMSVTDCDIVMMGATGGTRPAQLVDTGAAGYGPDGCVLNNVRITCASPTNGMLIDNANATPTARSVIKGCSVNGTPTNGITINTGSNKLLLENNILPTLKITNSSTASSITLRNNVTLTQNYESRLGLNDSQTTTGADTTVQTYGIAQNACSATGGWRLRAWGTYTCGATGGTRRIRMRLGATNVNSLALEASTSKSWFMEGTIINRSIATQSLAARRLINDGTGPDSTQVFTHSLGTVDFSSGAQNITLDYQLVAGDTSIIFRGWEVIPFGHDAA